MEENKQPPKTTKAAPANWCVQAGRLYVQSVHQTSYEGNPGVELTYSEHLKDAIFYKEYAEALRIAKYVGHGAVPLGFQG